MNESRWALKELKMSADDIFSWANWLLVGSLVLGVLSTYAIVVSGNIKESNLRRELTEKDRALEVYKVDAARKISDANTIGETAKADAAKANERAEHLRADNLALQTRVRPRRFSFMGWTTDPKRVSEIYNGLKPFAGTDVLIQVVPDFEAKIFAQDIASVLATNGWKPRIVTEEESHMSDLSFSEWLYTNPLSV